MTVDNANPLSEMRVIEMTTRVAGPFSPSLLAEFGADVLKVELPGQGDPFRLSGEMTEAGMSLGFINENRNKKSITLDVRNPAGLAIFKRLVADCDILIENFRPGTLEAWALDYDTLKSIKPNLILVRISAYGQDGPYKGRSGVARVALGYAGMSYLIGESDGPPLMATSKNLAF